MKIIRWNELAATPWKNGGGTTRNVAAAPDGATVADFDWRVSIADVEADGPFSAFEGVDRVIMLIDGEAMELDVAGDAHALTRLEPLAFPGDAASSCRVPKGRTRDVNLMTRRGRATGAMRAVRVGGAYEATVARGETVVLLGLSDGLAVAARPGESAAAPGPENTADVLGVLDVVVCDEQGTLRATGDGTLVEIRVGGC